MKPWKVVLAAVAVGAVGWMAVAMSQVMARGPDWRIGQLYGGPTSIACLRDPQSVDAFVLDPAAEGPAEIGAYAKARGPVPVDAAAVAELSAILLDAASYDWQRAKPDAFRPTFGLRFSRDASRLDLAVCFESDMVVAHRMGRRIGVEDVDAVRERLLAIARRLFPDEPRFRPVPGAR